MNLFFLAKPAIFALPAEQAHEISLKALKAGLVPAAKIDPDPRLSVNVAGIDFPNPVGLAAGYDKNAEVPDAILRLGFGFTEVGTITPRPQSGNPKPRVFRLVRDQGIINRLGFNNQGHAAALERLQQRSERMGIVGVNIGANKTSNDFVADYEKGIDAFYSVASYFTANISSPNTPGLRNLQAGEALKTLLDRMFDVLDKKVEQTGKTVPVFLKIAPDLHPSEMDDIAKVVSGSRLSALIVSNTTLDRDHVSNKTVARETGGLSGAPLFNKSTRVLAEMYDRIGKQIPLIGVGGVGSANDAITKIKAGASLVQLYSRMVYKGPCLPAEIVTGMSQYCDQHSLDSICELVGTGYKEWTSP